MFKKPLSNLSPLAPLRRSDRRKLVEELLQAFPEVASSIAEGDLSQAKNHLVPEGILTGKFRTHLGEGGKIFVDPGNGEPLWFTCNDIMVPTVYTLWKFPRLCPIVQTPSPVLEKLQSGADLMIPGLFNTIPQHVVKNDLVAVEIDNAIVAIGFAALDFSGLWRYKHGKAVYIIHALGDEVWIMGGKKNACHISEKQVDQEVEGIAANIEKMEIIEPEWPELSTKEIDEAFRSSLLYALQMFGKTGAPELPMPSSLFISSHIQPYLVSHNPNLHLKKSSWKKAQKFLKEMSKEGFLTIRERGGEVVITSMNLSNPQVMQFELYDLPTVRKAKRDEETTTKKTGEMIEIRQLWKPTGKVSAVFEAVGKSKSGLYTAPEIREVLQLYIDREGLVDASNRRMVRLDSVLSAFVDTAQLCVGRDVLVERALKSSAQYHALGAGKPQRGPPPRVKVVTEKRQGNKVVMRIANLDAFGIDLGDVASELRVVCASSTSVGAAPGNPHAREVLVQGAHVGAVVACLWRRGVAQGHLDLADRAAKKNTAKTSMAV